MTESVYARIPRNGRTARQLAEKTGMSIRTAQRWTSIPREDWLAQSESRYAKIRELRSTGLSMRAIASEIGCSVGTVHRALKSEDASA